jgi:molybdopterin adenylyltransferase
VEVTVITISDRAYRGMYEDLSGQAMEEALNRSFPEIKVERKLVLDDQDKLLEALRQSLTSDFIFTTGGTGIGERDITPDVCSVFCDKALPGVAEILRAKSFEKTPNALLSRGYAGIKNKTIIINFPGSLSAVKLGMEIFMPIMPHAMEMINNGDHS